MTKVMHRLEFQPQTITATTPYLNIIINRVSPQFKRVDKIQMHEFINVARVIIRNTLAKI